MKIIAYYLPQFHSFPENDVWWGEGFTEWNNVKGAKPLFKGHVQPRVPYGNNYYDLTDIETIRWQSRIAQEYGIYGFCYYHYWFNGKKIMEKPMELMLSDNEISMPFCISWANHDWTKAWRQKSKEILLKQTYGEESDWIEHYNYLSTFFKDKRYILVENKPLLIIYMPQTCHVLKEMITLWNNMAREDGFDGICLGYQHWEYDHIKDKNGNLFDYAIEYEPMLTKSDLLYTLPSISRKLLHEVTKKMGFKPYKWNMLQYDYDNVWRHILNRRPRDAKSVPGAFVDWDNSPRYGRDAFIYPGYSAEKFENYLLERIRVAQKFYKKDFMFMFAWNEWGEGGYLEPDENEKYDRLVAIQNALLRAEEDN